MRVVQLIDSLHLGGTELHVLKLVRALRERGVPVRVVHIGADGPLRADYAAMGITVEPCRVGPFRSLQLPSQLRRLRRVLDAEGTTVVHAHDRYSNLAAALLPVTGRRWRLLVSQRWGRPESAGWRLASRIAFGRADLVTANGEGTAAIARTFVPSGRVSVVSVPNFLERSCFAPVDRAALRSRLVPGLPAHAPLLGYVGRLEPLKRVDWLIDALAHVRAAGFDARLLVVGDGSELSRLRERAAAAAVAAHVTFAGALPRLPLPHPAFDVQLLASSTEGVPNALVEGMAAGRPIVATAVGGVPSLLDGGRAGRLVKAVDPVGFRAAVLDLLENGEAAAALGATAADLARERWHEDVIVPALLALYAGTT